jgi:hypothetical protein
LGHLDINPEARMAWHDIGSGVNILVIDDVLRDPKSFQRFAHDKRYHVPRAGEYYPGWVSEANAEGEIAYFNEVAKLFMNKIWPEGHPKCLSLSGLIPRTNFAVFGIDQRAALDGGFVDQHVDGAVWLAAITYLFEPQSSGARGTAFWKYKPLNLQTFCAADAASMAYQEKFLGLRFFDQLRDSAEFFPTHDIKELSRHIMGGPVEGRQLFSLDENEKWELMKFVPAKFNRLVAYPASQFHSAVDTTEPPSISMGDARLTFNGLIPYPWDQKYRAKPLYQGSYRDVSGMVTAD